jgi:hypothetical protein
MSKTLRFIAENSGELRPHVELAEKLTNKFSKETLAVALAMLAGEAAAFRRVTRGSGHDVAAELGQLGEVLESMEGLVHKVRWAGTGKKRKP